jgi:hypothetical protein
MRYILCLEPRLEQRITWGPPSGANGACSAVQCSAVQCSAVQCSAEQSSAVQCSAVQCSAVQCSAFPTQGIHGCPDMTCSFSNAITTFSELLTEAVSKTCWIWPHAKCHVVCHMHKINQHNILETLFRPSPSSSVTALHYNAHWMRAAADWYNQTIW